MVNEEAEEHKKRGNDSFKEKKFEEAIKHYNKAITLDPENAAYYSNRSAAWSSKGNHESALADANRCIQKDSNFAKGYARKGKAYFDMDQPKDAEEAYKEGLTKEPGNDACTRGLEDIKASKGKKKGARSGGGAAGAGGGSGMDIVWAQLKKGGKMQMYFAIMCVYYLYNHFMGPKTKGEAKDSFPDGGVSEDHDDTPAVVGSFGRRFKELDSMWMSYMEMAGDAKPQTMLLMLHRTSLSAEAEFGSAFPQLSKAVSRTSRIVAPDRPCHGFTPCPAAGEPQDAAWLTKLVRTSGPPEKIAVVAVGREAAAQALALAERRREVTNILLISPKVVAPERVKIKEAADLDAWLAKHGAPASAQVTADVVRWAASPPAAVMPAAALKVKKLPDDCSVTIVYEKGDEEDDELKAALEAEGAEVKTRRTSSSDALSDILADEVKQAVNPDTSDTEMD